MNPSNLKESETVELKESFKDDALKTLCAFANTKGGSLFVGVKDDSTLLGGSISDEKQQQIINKIVNQLNIQPGVVLHEQSGNEFLEIKVSKSSYPVNLRGRFYKRIGNTTRELSLEEQKTLLLKDVPWDSQVREGITFDNLATNLTTPIAIRAYENIHGASPESLDEEDFFEHLGLIKGGKITNAALLMFGDNQSPSFPFAKVRIGRFKGESTIVADHTIGRTLINQLQESERVIKTLLNKRYRITGKSFQREEVWEYPLEAIREAILNALVHRDYHINNAHIEIKIFDDHILISSPGSLPEGISVDQLKKSHPSVRRNPLIAETLFRAGYIEQFGTGTLRMKETLRKAGHPDPEFSEEENRFTVRFDAAPEPVDLDSLDLNERQLKAVELAREGEIQASDLHENYPEVNRKTITRDLTELVEQELFEKTGKGKGTRYHLRFKR
ncbi:MAG: transcriptional regulator [Balneolaceae bacterium]|nr:transcriptional regulator [Balneolaceae bacterium]